MINLRRFPVPLAFLILLAASAWSLAQQPPKNYVPPELQASDPQVKAYIDAGEKSAEEGNYPEAFQQLQKALDFCVKKGFLGDKALVEAHLSVAYFLQGKIDDTKRFRLASFADSLRTGNLVLQADSLVALSAIAQVSSNANEALDLASKALDAARRSTNLWIQSRALGELGRMQLLAGKFPEARASVEEALRIDRLNHYRWETSHLLYLALVTATDDSKLDQAIQLAASAHDLAIKYEDYLTFMQASTVLAQGYVRKGKMNDGIALLEHSRDGISEDGKPLFAQPASYRAASALPYPKIAFLEAMAMAYQAGQRPDDAIKTWSELYELSKTTGFTLAAAESAHNIADLFQAKKEAVKAIPYYALAADAWAAGGNAKRRIDALASEAFVLSQQSQGEKALPIYEELLPLVEASGDLRRLFLFELSIVEIVQPRGDMERAARALQKAESLVAPELTVAGVEPKFILELYLRLADFYGKQGEPVGQLVALEKALTPAGAIDTQTMAFVDSAVKEKLMAIHAQDLADKAYAANDFVDALRYLELLEHFEQIDAKWNNRLAEYNKGPISQTVSRLLEIPFKIIIQPDGAKALEANLQQMGPVAQMARLPILIALSSHFMQARQPDQVVKFATAALPFLRLGENDHPQRWDVQLACQLAASLLLQKDTARAVRQAGPCLRSAQKLNDPQLLAMAHQINVWILQAAGRQSEAQESLRFLMQHVPDDPMQYEELAQLKAVEGSWAEAIEARRQALRIYTARKDLNGMASTQLALAAAVGSARQADSATENSEEERTLLESALALFKQLDNPEGQARASSSLGKYFARQKNSSQARSYFDAALKFSRQAKNAPLEANVLSEIGNAYRDAGEPAKALESYRKSAEVYHAINSPADEAFQLRNQSGALDDLHKPEEALVTGLKAKRLADTTDSWLPRYWVRRSLAWLYEARGDYDSGLAALYEARDISNSANQPLNSAWASLALAQGLSTAGEREEALDAINLALPVFRQFKDAESEVGAYIELMDIYGARESDFKDLDKALAYYQSARQVVEKNDPARMVSLNAQVIEIYWQQKRFKEAIALAKEAAAHYQRTKDDLGEAHALMSLAEVQRSDGDLSAAAATLARSEPLVRRANDFYGTGRFHYGQARQWRKEGRFKEAIEQYERVIGLLEQFKSTGDLSLRRKASETYGFIYDELVDTWHSLGNQEQQSRVAAADKALQYAELNKSRVFTSSWGRTFIEALKHQLPASLQEKERALTARQVALQSELQQSMSGQGSRLAKQVQDDLKHLASELAALQKELRDVSPAYAEARYPRPVAIADIPLRPGELLVEFKMLENADALMVWMLNGADAGAQNGPQLAAFYKVDHPRQWFEERILAMRSVFNRGFPDQFDPETSEELFNALFPAPYAQRLTAAKAVIFVPDDILFLLPFEMLSPQASKSQFVLLKTPTSYFPSTAALRLSRAVAPARREWAEQFFALADPITTADDERYTTASIAAEVESIALKPVAVPQSDAPQTAAPQSPAADPQTAVRRGPLPMASLKARGYFFERLPETATEASHIAALFPAADSTVVRTGMDATKRALLQTDLGRFRFVHFATHGFLPVEPGVREPALVLSYDGKNEERMMLTLSEVVQLKLHAEMVVLSACNTGSGRVTRAEGVASLGTSFLAAGASSVTVSLWQVADQSTAILMEEYYRNLLSGVPKNAALAAARAALVAKGYTNPFYWAPFVLTGE
ncbi:MAG: CHAT domain-containing protein [Acidobacteriia bacterium]|nr:CHAT domain-containing protein [Terriglobia bacterium]